MLVGINVGWIVVIGTLLKDISYLITQFMVKGHSTTLINLLTVTDRVRYEQQLRRKEDALRVIAKEAAAKEAERGTARNRMNSIRIRAWYHDNEDENLLMPGSIDFFDPQLRVNRSKYWLFSALDWAERILPRGLLFPIADVIVLPNIIGYMKKRAILKRKLERAKKAGAYAKSGEALASGIPEEDILGLGFENDDVSRNYHNSHDIYTFGIITFTIYFSHYFSHSKIVLSY